MIEENIILKAKQTHLPDLIRQKNINLISTNNGSSFKCLCPFHQEKEPSLNINLKDNIWLFNCFGCGTGGTPIDFEMKYHNIDFKQAVQNLTGATLKHKTPEIKPCEKSELFSMVAKHYHNNMLKPDSKGRAYLEKRCLLDEDLIKTFKIGYSTNDASNKLFEHRVQLREELGIFKVNYHETFANSVIFPVMDLNDQVTDLYARRITTYKDRATHCYNKGKHQSIFNSKNCLNQSTIYLTEGIIDALSIYKAGIKNVTALYGTNGFTPAHQELFNNGTVKEVILCLDNDEAGTRATEKLKSKLNHLTIKKVNLPQGMKDINEVLVKQGIKSLRAVIETPSFLMEAIKNEANETVKEDSFIDQFKYHQRDLHYQTPQVHYKVRQARTIKNLDSLRFVVTASKDNQTYTDRLDLYLSRSRKSFESIVSKTLKVQNAVIEKDLLTLIEFIENDYEKRKNQNQPNKPKHKELTIEEKQEAYQFLKKPNLIELIKQSLTHLGYVGEDANKLLLYLCATSRKLDKPISVLIRSQSSSGKSFLMGNVCHLLPSEDVYKWTSLTPKALYYMDEDALKHKFLAIDEREGMEDAEYPIRSLQSGGELTLAVPVKNPSTGKTTTEQIVKEGPIAYVDGSTDTKVNPENANRCFEIYLDETRTQTIKVQNQQRQSFTIKGWKKNIQKEGIKRIHQNAQRLLKPIKVIIPYVESLEFPSSWIRTRRDHDRFLSLIVCITFLHQYQREQKIFNELPYIESTVEDYEIAYKLGSQVIFNSFQELEKPLCDFYVNLQSMVKNKAKEQNIDIEQYWFTRRDVRQHLQLPDYIVHRFMKQLTELEYFNTKGGTNGKRMYYQMSQIINQNKIFEGLTTPEELRHRLNRKKETNKENA